MTRWNIAVVCWYSYNEMFDHISIDLNKAGHRTVRFADRTAFAAVEAPLKDIDLLLCVAVFPITRAVLQSVNRLRAIVSAVTGVEGIDFPAAADCGVVVANAQTDENIIGMGRARPLC